MDQLREIVDVAIHRIVAVRRPLAIAVAAQVGRNDVPVGAQGLSHGVPVAAMVATAMHEQQRRRVRVTPLHEVQALALGEKRLRRWSGQIGRHIGVSITNDPGRLP